MVDSDKKSAIAASTDAPPESPTTVKPLEFDDENEDLVASTPTKKQETEPIPKPPPKDEAPPTKPPRPLSPREQAEQTLREAFPSIDILVVRAVLTASRGEVEPAFNALLGMSDPDAAREDAPPTKPPRPVHQPTNTTTTNLSQLEADEMYARQLAEQYSGATRESRPRQQNTYNEHLPPSRVGRPGANPNPDDVPWRSFLDDDLPEFRDNIKKGFLETQQTVNKWLGKFTSKSLAREQDEDFMNQPVKIADSYGSGAPTYGRRSAEGRRSADMSRYDADPEVIDDDFSKLGFKDSEAGNTRRTTRPLANPDLFRTTATSNRTSSPGSGRKVSFQSGPPEEIKDMYSSTPTGTTVKAQGNSKSSKWQPLSTVDPSPVAEHDPFSLGDSDDERDAKPITMRDIDEEEGDHAQVKKTTSEAMKDEI